MPYHIVGNAWKKQTSEGKTFLSLSFKENVKKGAAVFMFPNDNKRPDKQDPDWVLSIRDE